MRCRLLQTRRFYDPLASAQIHGTQGTGQLSLWGTLSLQSRLSGGFQAHRGSAYQQELSWFDSLLHGPAFFPGGWGVKEIDSSSKR